MKKQIVLIVLALIGAGAVGWYYYRTSPCLLSSCSKKPTQGVMPFFSEVPKQLAQANSEVEKLVREGASEKPIVTKTENGEITSASPLAVAKATLESLRIIDIIMRRDIDQLKSTAVESLQRNIDVSIGGEHFKHIPTDQGIVTSAQLAGENALAMVLFHAALDKTQQDKDATLAMLQVLFDKKLDPNTKGGIVYWVQPPGEQGAYDYVALLSLPEVASEFSFREAANKLRDYKQSFKKTNDQQS